MFVSVYTIAKNEEQVARRWYDCFKEADEVCVLVRYPRLKPVGLQDWFPALTIGLLTMPADKVQAAVYR